MMKKMLLCASLILFLQVIFLFVFKGNLQAYTNCYVNGTRVGDMHNWDTQYGYPFLVKGRSGTVEFAAYKGVVANNEVQFRPGGGAWTPYSLRQIKSTRDRYFLDFAVPNDDKCGPWWTNTMFRYLLDGQNHYCNDRTVKYSLGPYKSNFINPGCLNTATGCKLSDPLARQAGFHNGYYIEATIPEGKSCSDYKFYIYNGSTAAPGTFQYLGPQECKIESGRFSWPAYGEITAYTSNFLEVYVHDASGQLQLYNFINNNYCGGALVDSGPTPTPTPTTAVVPTPTPTCAPVTPDQPILSSPADGSRFFSGSVTMKWRALDSWGKGCPTNDNRFKVYLTTNWSYASDGDLSNNGLAAICEVDSSTLQCARTGL